MGVEQSSMGKNNEMSERKVPSILQTTVKLAGWLAGWLNFSKTTGVTVCIIIYVKSAIPLSCDDGCGGDGSGGIGECV
ncbi:hypothetical protein M0802_016616 [Mischocyttarus mexicanus]|nr:hypothetical protein M0802_016616 [Mischocyttarus mexicanus]